ncbi:ABC transporter permease [Novacetimonas sp. GS1]|uniref:ABC transporter permease n=1 Tax=Novacetimonas sp. GS1 TaxID=3119990 RepID=UPI002FCCE4A6
MNARIINKMLMLPVVMLVVSFAVFVAVRHLPGDPARMLAGPAATQDAVDAVHHSLGLDRPVMQQYGGFMRGALAGDLGVSIESRQPVGREIASHFPYTLLLGLSAYALALCFGIPGGLAAAMFQDGMWDRIFMGITIVLASVPNFWFALLLMELFSVRLGLLPLMGAHSWSSLLMPSLTLALMPMALIGRMTRASMIAVLSRDYIRTARAKGVGLMRLCLRHALPNALPPVITVIGMNLGSVIGGAVVTETVFGWPGLGHLMIEAVRWRDYPVIEGVTLVAVLSVILVNLAADILISRIDPKARRI